MWEWVRGRNTLVIFWRLATSSWARSVSPAAVCTLFGTDGTSASCSVLECGLRWRHTLHCRLMRWCSQISAPPQSLHLLLRRWCSQRARAPAFLAPAPLSLVRALSCLWRGHILAVVSDVLRHFLLFRVGKADRAALTDTVCKGRTLAVVMWLLALHHGSNV